MDLKRFFAFGKEFRALTMVVKRPAWMQISDVRRYFPDARGTNGMLLAVSQNRLGRQLGSAICHAQ
jgi:hypothetical protein